MADKILSFREMEVWQNAMNLVDIIYAITKNFPKEEIFVLTSQIRRCAISIPSNIAEVFQRKNTREFIHFCYISQGSLSELETQLEIAKRQQYLSDTEEINNIIVMIRKQLFSLIKKLKLRIENEHRK